MVFRLSTVLPMSTSSFSVFVRLTSLFFRHWNKWLVGGAWRYCYYLREWAGCLD